MQYELWHSQKLDLRNIYTCGCTSFVMAAKEKGKKFDNHAVRGMFIQNLRTCTQYRSYNHKARWEYYTHAVVFHETIFYDCNNGMNLTEYMECEAELALKPEFNWNPLQKSDNESEDSFNSDSTVPLARHTG